MKKPISCWLRTVFAVLFILLVFGIIQVILYAVNPECVKCCRYQSNASQWLVAVATLGATYLAAKAFCYSKYISRFQAENAVFTQLYTQQNVIVNNRDYDFATILILIPHLHTVRLNGNAYRLFSEYLDRSMCKSNSDLHDMAHVWDGFTQALSCRRSATLSSAFKYLHDEIKWVEDTENKLVDQEKKKSYVSLVQSQLNYDQLLCYMFNLARYNSTRSLNPREDPYITLLRESKFFENLYDSSDYRDILNKYVKRSVLEVFISKDYMDEVDNRI